MSEKPLAVGGFEFNYIGERPKGCIRLWGAKRADGTSDIYTIPEKGDCVAKKLDISKKEWVDWND